MNERYKGDRSVLGYLARLHAEARLEHGAFVRAWLGHQVVADLLNEMGINEQPVFLFGLRVDIDWRHATRVWFE